MMSNSAEIIGKRLYQAGCRRAFGIPGGEVLDLMEGLKNSGIEFFLTKHENSAGFMAEGGYHADGAPAVLLATLGPGVANAVNVVTNALQDRVPMIFLTGCVDASDELTYTHQVFNHGELLKSVTKASITVVDGMVDVVIDKAVSIAMDGQPGPVHVDVPISVASKEQPAVNVTDENPLLVRGSPSPAVPADGADLETARKLLRDAKQPIMIAGIDVLNQSAEEAVKEFVMDFRIPLITTYKAKGIFPEDNPLSLGSAGLSPLADQHLLPLVHESDLIIAAGYDPIEMRAGWRNPWGETGKVIEFTAVPNTHYMHQADLSFVGHIGEGLKTFRRGVSHKPFWKGNKPINVRNQLKSIFSGKDEWGPGEVIETVREILPANGVATVDSGAHRILLSQLWECYEPRGLLQSTGLCTMGCAVPLAMGFQIASPERPVVAFTGDAGLEMVLGELATLRDLKLPLVIVVFVDESLALIELKQRRSEMPNLGVDFGPTNFPKVAEALGGEGRWVSDRSDLFEAFEGAFERQTFSLLACKIGYKVYDDRF